MFDRRQIVGLATAGAASLLLPDFSVPARAQTNAQTQAHADEAGRFLDHFSALGFRPLEPLELITDYGFNGGLRYDDTRPDYPDALSMCIQPACRVEDAERSGVPGVLALFNIMALNVPDPAGAGRALEQIVEFIIEKGGLDPEQLVYVSSELFRPYMNGNEILQKGRFVERDLNEAMATGDGSGYFAPTGHPQTPGSPSVSIHYPVKAGTSGELGYPLPGYLEIADVGLQEEGVPHSGLVGGGIGLERLALAAGRQAPDFAESRTAFLELAQTEAADEGRDLPPGYEVYAEI